MAYGIQCVGRLACVGGVLVDVMSWIVCVCVCGVEWMWWVLSEGGDRRVG